MPRNIRIITTLFFSGLLMSVNAQDIHFSQYTMTPLLINPAQTGASNHMRAVMNYKNQWSSVAEPYATYNFSFDLSNRKKQSFKGFSAYGINLFNDKAGDAQMGTFQGSLSYAYHVFLSDRSTLGGGLYAAYGQRSMDFTKLQWGSQYDGMSYNATLPSGEPASGENFSFLDFGGGFHWKYGKSERYMRGNDQRTFNAGLAVFHVNRPNYSFYDSGEKLQLKKVAYFNALIGVNNTNMSVVPGILYMRQGKAYELMVGSLFRYQFKEDSKYTGYVKGSSMSTGLFYRNRDALIATLMYEFSQYTVSISYDVNMSGLKSASKGKGGVEIALRFVSPNPFIYSKSRYY